MDSQISKGDAISQGHWGELSQDSIHKAIQQKKSLIALLIGYQII